MKAKVECVQKAARPATGTYQLSMEHFPWRPQLKLAYIHQSRVHLSVPQSWDSQCKYGYNTLHGACTSQRQLRSPAAVRDPESLTAPWLQFPESASISRRFGSKGLDSSGKKISKLSSPLCQSHQRKKCNYPIHHKFQLRNTADEKRYQVTHEGYNVLLLRKIY